MNKFFVAAALLVASFSVTAGQLTYSEFLNTLRDRDISFIAAGELKDGGYMILPVGGEDAGKEICETMIETGYQPLLILQNDSTLISCEDILAEPK